jgi:hypothetical protein
MNVPFALWCAVLAAVALVSASLFVVVWRSGVRPTRGRVMIGLSIWLGVDVALATVGAFRAQPHRLVPGIAVGIALPLVAGAWLLTRDGNAVERLTDSIPLGNLIGVQVYRAVGAVFLIAWAQGLMPAAFAFPAGIGDVTVGLAAPFVARRLAAGAGGSARLASAWNALGIVDLVVAITLGFLTSPSPLQQLALGHPNTAISRAPFVLIPVFAVPLSLLLHLVVVRRAPTKAPAGQPRLAHSS